MVCTGGAWWRLGSSAALLGGAMVWGATACSTDDTSTPTGAGNTVHVDVDATNQPGPPSGGSSADSPFAPVDGSIYTTPDGYDPYGTCQKCGCPATDYCFGGGTGYASFSGDCNPTAFGVGCQPIPAACVGKANICDCLIQATAAMVPCYPECVDTTRILYCPHP